MSKLLWIISTQRVEFGHPDNYIEVKDVGAHLSEEVAKNHIEYLLSRQMPDQDPFGNPRVVFKAYTVKPPNIRVLGKVTRSDFNSLEGLILEYREMLNDRANDVELKNLYKHDIKNFKAILKELKNDRIMNACALYNSLDTSPRGRFPMEIYEKYFMGLFVS